jgi:hypothetical protein
MAACTAAASKEGNERGASPRSTWARSVMLTVTKKRGIHDRPAPG